MSKKRVTSVPITRNRRSNRMIDKSLNLNGSLVLISDSEEEDIPSPAKRRKTIDKSIELIEEPVIQVLISDDEDLISEDEGFEPSAELEINVKRNIKRESTKIKLDPLDDLMTDDEDETQSLQTKVNVKTEKSIKSDKNEQRINVENIKCEWKDFELLSQQQDLKPNISKNLIKLFQDGNTIPFIARYRRDATENMSPEKLREVRDTFDEICQLKQKMQTVIKTIDKSGALEPQLEKTVRSATTLEELEIIYAPFKPGGKRTLAERAKDLGLEQPAQNILNNTEQLNLSQYVEKSKKDLSSVEAVQKGIIHIIAYILATDTDVLSYLRKMRKEVNFILETKKMKTRQTAEGKVKNKGKSVDETKFENYFDFKIPVKFVKPHQVLAINRGEHHKILSVKIVVPDFVFNNFSKFCWNKWGNKGKFDISRKNILEDAIKDSYTRLVQPLIIREIRSELKTLAEKASHEVFSKNLKQLVLSAPLKGQQILAIDPGFTGGCKIALVSKTGSVLSFDWIYPHDNRRTQAGVIVRNMLKEHDCSLIALGNGTACRETEEWLTHLIKQGFFLPMNVKYTIVTEDGASIYSCSAEAKKEFPKLDTNIISAVSLARRIQDPLAELVKIEPQHLGVGMYQHDLKKKTLEEALNEVVSECVSFVGVNLNTASQCLLRKIAGLSEKRATQIVQYREKNGPFQYREQLTKVFGIGAKIFQQCAGFLRVGPTDSQEAKDFYKKPKTTKLDCTYIHPESYEIAHKLMKKFNLDPESIGEPHFISRVKSINVDIASLSSELKSSEETIKLIVDALSKPLNYDLRSDISQEPLFRQGLTSMTDLRVGTSVTGRVRNVTHFGCFVDIGVGTDALLHQSKMKGLMLYLGDRITAKVENVDVNRKRIGLREAAKI